MKEAKKMDTLCVFTGVNDYFGDEIIVKFSTASLKDAGNGAYERLSQDFVREFRRICRHCDKGENLATVLKRDIRSKDLHVAGPAWFIWDQTRYQVGSQLRGDFEFFYKNLSQARKYWQSDLNPTWVFCTHERADEIGLPEDETL